jgi:integrase
VERYRERKVERFLSEDELGRLGRALAQADRDGTPSPASVAAIRLLVLTGMRLGEVLTLRWENVDLKRSLIQLHDSKTGPKLIPLNAPAVEVLRGLDRRGSPWVIPGSRPGAHLVNLSKPWARIRAAARLEAMRLHDLRHSFASIGVGTGLGLPIIGKLLGHTQAATTQRYAHLADDPLRQASEAIGRRLSEALEQ